MSISYDDVERIVRLLDASRLGELVLEANGMKLTLRRGAADGSEEAGAGAAKVNVAKPSPAKVDRPAMSFRPDPPPPDTRPEARLLDICAPMLGTFRRTPRHGGRPFVDLGTRVDEDTVIGVIEVTKLTNSVPAGLRGEVVDVRAKDGELVEFEQVLMRVRPL